MPIKKAPPEILFGGAFDVLEKLLLAAIAGLAEMSLGV